jgi:hypothetical protein
MRASFASLTTAIARHWGWLMAALALAVLVAGNYYMAGLQPRRPAPVTTVQRVPPNDPSALKLAAEVDALEKAYHTGINAAVPDPAAMTALEQAVQKQRQLVDMLATKDNRPATRLGNLETELAGARAQENLTQIDQLEREGRQALAAGDVAGADPKLHEALRLMHAVNLSRAPALYKDTSRESDLAQAVAVVETEPLHRDLEDLLASARAAKAQQPAAARAALVKARNLQARINRDHPTSPYADVAAVASINAEIETLAAEDLRAQSEAAEQAGDKAQTAGHAPEAAEDFAEARAKQLEINDSFKLSQVVSEERVAALETKRQTAASILTSDLVAGLDLTITDLLRHRQPAAAATKINEAARTMDKLAATFPESRRLDGALKTRLDYLASRAARLEEIHRLVYDNLLPVPGTQGRQLLKTEVTQELYERVAGDNPSRNAGPGLPVDSVSWLDAQVFCTRLSWLLGLPARLPDEAEYRAALGKDNGAGGWSHESSPDTTQPAGRQAPNAAGFCDLLGNVAEWLAADEAADEAAVAGGSYLDPPATLAKVPVELRAKNDRARHIGFRFLVEQPLPLPARAAPAAAGAPNITAEAAPHP